MDGHGNQMLGAPNLSDMVWLYDGSAETVIRIRLAHPTLPGRDLILVARPDVDESFSLPLPALEKTHWRVVLEGSGREWRLAGRWDRGRQPALTIDADVR